MKNVVLLPHIGGGTTESRSEARSLAVGQRCRRAPRPRAAFTCESASGVSPCHSRMNGAHTPRIASTSFELAFAAMPLVAIIRLTAPHGLRPVAAALQAARVGCLEVTLTTPYAIESIAALRAEFGDALQIGAGNDPGRKGRAHCSQARGPSLLLRPHFNSTQSRCVSREAFRSFAAPTHRLKPCRRNVRVRTS